MIVEDQSATVAFLSEPATFGRPGAEVAHIQTHISEVFLVGGDAYKLKRAVRYDYVDFSTAERRRRACEAEVAINRRTAPELYLGVVAVTRDPGGRLALGGAGTAVDWLVHMRRFDQQDLLDRMARRGALTDDLVAALAEAVVSLHQAAARRPDKGGRAGMAWVVESNLADLAAHAGGPFPAAAVEAYARSARAAVERLGPLLDERRADGLVRHCHGDLHLGNICLFRGRPTLFDAIEFNDDIACCDILYDLAFLLMDLMHRGLRPFANRVLDHHVTAIEADRGLAALPLFLSARAAVRAKVTVTAAETGAPDPAALIAEAGRYFADARAYLAPGQPRLVALGGLSGSGKSTLARRLAPALEPAPGAVVLRSDVVRKRLFGLAPTERLPENAYGEETTRRVYETITRRAAVILAAGHSVVADAVFARPHQRRAIAAVAREAGVAFAGLWLAASPETLIARVRARAGDASDADEAVVRHQLAYDVGPLAWPTVDTAGSVEAVAARVGAALALDPQPAG